MAIDLNAKLADPATRREWLERFETTSESDRRRLVPEYYFGMPATEWVIHLEREAQHMAQMPSIQRFQRKLNEALQKEGKGINELDSATKGKVALKALGKIICAKDGCKTYADKKCARCFQVYYCSAACQKAHWRSHKVTCVSPNK